MRHARAHRLLSAHLDGELSAARSREIDLHLEECSRCKNEHQDLRATIGLLASLGDQDPPPHLHERILSRIESEAKRGGPASTLNRIGDWFRAPVKAPVAALALGLLGFAVLRVTTGPELGGWLAEPPSPSTLTTPFRAPLASPMGVARGQAPMAEASLPIQPSPRPGEGLRQAPLAQAMDRVRPSTPGRHFGASAAPGTTSRTGNSLAGVIRQPQLLLEEILSLEGAARELRIAEWGQRAVEAGRSVELAQAIRETGTPEALRIAAHLEALGSEESSAP